MELNALYTKHSVTEISRKRLAEIQKALEVKSFTEKGKERKLRLVEKLIEQRENFLIANHYVCFTIAEISHTYSPSKKHEYPSHSRSDGRQFKKFFRLFCQIRIHHQFNIKSIKIL